MASWPPDRKPKTELNFFCKTRIKSFFIHTYILTISVSDDVGVYKCVAAELQSPSLVVIRLQFVKRVTRFNPRHEIEDEIIIYLRNCMCEWYSDISLLQTVSLLWISLQYDMIWFPKYNLTGRNMWIFVWNDNNNSSIRIPFGFYCIIG